MILRLLIEFFYIFKINSKKRDWNALVRTNTGKRDPIGTTAEAMTKRSRQSLRMHILDNVSARTIDPQKLLGMS